MERIQATFIALPHLSSALSSLFKHIGPYSVHVSYLSKGAQLCEGKRLFGIEYDELTPLRLLISIGLTPGTRAENIDHTMRWALFEIEMKSIQKDHGYTPG